MEGRAFGIAVQDRDLGAGAADPAGGRHIGAHDRRAQFFNDRERRGRNSGGAPWQRTVIHIVGRVGGIARYPDSRAAQPVGVERAGVVGWPLHIRGRRIERVGGGQHVEQDRRVAHGAGQRAGGVLAVRDRDDAGAADQPDRRLDRDQAVLARRRQQRARGLGADRRRRQTRRDRHRRPGARPAGRHDRHAALVELRRIGVFHLTAERAVARRHVDRQDVGEFGQIGLAEDDRARLPQQCHDGCVAPGLRLGQGQRAGSRVLHVGGGDVVLDQDRDALERPARRRARRIDCGGDCRCVRVDLAHGVEPRAGAVISLDPRQIGLDQGRRNRSAGRERLLQIGDRRVLDAGTCH